MSSHRIDRCPSHKQARLVEAKSKMLAASFGDSNLRHSTAITTVTSKSSSKNPGPHSKSPGPWVPPPGRTTSGGNYAWSIHGSSHRLEIIAPEVDRLRMSDITTDDEDQVNNKMMKSKKKIGMSEVGSLRSLVALQKTMIEMDKEEFLENSQQVLEEQEMELEDYRQELETTEIENRTLHRRMDKLRDSFDINKSASEHLSSQKDSLMNKLTKVEMDGQAASRQVAALNDVIRRLREEKCISPTDSTMLTKQKELLMKRLADFEVTNRTLRAMLKERHKQEANGMRVGEQRDLLLRKLAETEDNVQRHRTQSLEKDHVIADLRMQIGSQREENVANSGLQSSTELTRAHLQKQLRQKDGDCNRMAVQIRSIESQLAEEKIEVDHLHQLLGAAKEKAERDKEALKKGTRIQKQRASKSRDTVEQINAQLLEREAVLGELRTDVDALRARCDQLTHEKSRTQAENIDLKTRITELEHLLERLKVDSKAKIESTMIKLNDKTSEAAVSKLESEQLKLETQSAQLEDAKGRYHEGTIDENHPLAMKVETLDRKMNDMETQNRDLLSMVAKQEEAVHQSNVQLDERTRECMNLGRQLESVLAEAWHQSEQTSDKNACSDHSELTRVLDLESQLSQARAKISRINREKEESERKFNSRLYDLKDRLEQSHSTNRSMQNYVQFIKNSYTNMFADTSMAMTSSPIRSKFH